MKVQFPHLSRAQKELLITWGKDSEVLVVQQVAANNHGLAISSLRILHDLQLMHAKDIGSVCKTSCSPPPPAPSTHTRTHQHTHTPKMACHFAAQALCLLSSATNCRQEGHTLADGRCGLGHGVPSSGPAHGSSVISQTNTVSMQKAVAPAGTLTFQSANARLERFSSLMLSLWRCACNRATAASFRFPTLVPETR